MDKKFENRDLHFLQRFLESQQEGYELLSELCPQDLGVEDGPPRTTEEEERCARIADTLGFDGNLFRNLFEHDEETQLRLLADRIKLIPKIIAKVEATKELPKLTEHQLNILRFLAQKKTPQLQKTIVAAVDISERTVRELLKELIDMGCVVNPHGVSARKGVVLTSFGEKLVTLYSSDG